MITTAENITAERMAAERAETGGPRRSIVKATGLCGVALLALTACEGAGGDGQEDTAQETADPDGAEDQGDAPEDIADDDSENGSGSDDDSSSDSESEEEAGEAPDIAQISDEIWANMEDAESMTLEATVPYDADQFEGTVEDEDAESLTERYSGQLDGSAMTLHREVGDSEEEYISFDDETFLRGEHEYRAFVEQYPGEVDEDELAEEFEGRWVEYTERFPEGFSIQEELDEFRSSFEDVGGFGELEGTTEQRDGEEVWVYSDEDREFVVRPGDDPVFLSVEADDDGEVVEVTFSEWNEAEEPQRPDEEDILTMDDLEALLD